MTKKQHNIKLDYKHSLIDVKKIDPSPFHKGGRWFQNDLTTKYF